jgi:PAS domain S-box-containing protein
LKQDTQNIGEASSAAVERGRVLDGDSGLGKRQLDEVSRLLPVLVLFHLCAAIAVSFLVKADIPISILYGWQFSTVALALLFMVVGYIVQTRIESASREGLVLRAMPYFGFLLALVWSVPPLVFSSHIAPDANILLLGIVITTLGIGVLSLLRTPATAILFSSTLTLALGQSFYGILQKHQEIAVIVVLLFGAALAGLIYLIHVDYLRRHLAQSELNRQSQIIKLLLNDFERETSDWLWETDRVGRLIYASPRLSEVLNKKPDELIGQEFLRMIDSTNRLRRKFILSQTEISNVEIEMVADGRTMYCLITARPLFDKLGQFDGYRGVGRDVTRQCEAELEIRNAKEKAERASAAKSQFLAVISHELRTPINAIVGFSEVLTASHNENLSTETRKYYLTTVLESARHLQSLINDVLDATRIERGTLQLTEQDNDAAELVEVAIKICRDQAALAKISIVAHVSEDIIIVGDMTRLKQVILNLLTNAIKFSLEGGVVNIDMQRGANSSLVISIRDAGIGISAEDAERVFEPFVQADGTNTRRFGGMGLGLSIARRIARIHGGDVTLSGELGIGTDAQLMIPAARVKWPRSTAQASRMVAA